MNENFHDATINGIFFDKKDNKLILQIELSMHREIDVEFINVVGWDFSPFEMQNILFDIHEYSSFSFPEWMQNDFDIPEMYLRLILSGEEKIFYLESSVGLN